MNVKRSIAFLAVVCGAMSTLGHAAPRTNGVRGSGAPTTLPAEVERGRWDYIAYKKLKNQGVVRLQGNNSLEANDGPVEYTVRSHWSIVGGTRLVLHSSMSARQLFGDRTVLLTRHMSTVLYTAPRGRRILAADLSLPNTLRAIDQHLDSSWQPLRGTPYWRPCAGPNGSFSWRGRDYFEWCSWYGQDDSGSSAQVGYKMNVQFKVRLNATHQPPRGRRWGNYR